MHRKIGETEQPALPLEKSARMRGDGPPYVKLGRSIRYTEGALLQWIKDRVHRSTSEQ
jgi:hypothetical protein